jgi:glycosyltransferase involved in cell wall biosynthesis
LACGCAIVASDTAPVQEFVRHGETGLLIPFLDPAALTAAILGILADDARTAWLRAGARAYAMANLRMRDHIVAYHALINRMTGNQLGAAFS